MKRLRRSAEKGWSYARDTVHGVYAPCSIKILQIAARNSVCTLLEAVSVRKDKQPLTFLIRKGMARTCSARFGHDPSARLRHTYPVVQNFALKLSKAPAPSHERMPSYPVCTAHHKRVRAEKILARRDGGYRSCSSNNIPAFCRMYYHRTWTRACLHLSLQCCGHDLLAMFYSIVRASPENHVGEHVTLRRMR